MKTHKALCGNGENLAIGRCSFWTQWTRQKSARRLTSIAPSTVSSNSLGAPRFLVRADSRNQLTDSPKWLPTADGHELRVRFPKQIAHCAAKPGKAAQSEEPHPFVVQLLPLAEAAVTVYARARDIADAEDFLAALERAHAWELTRRPADVNDLLSFWRETGSLGTLTEILAFVCDSQLRKTSDRERNEVLALERARSGAECLAAATVFCRKFTFQIPGETNAAAQAIDALACLPPDWRNEEVRALLNHALFDGASYGHIRFHHRRLSEFLAARWIQGLMVKGCPVGELEDLLFDARGSQRVLRPSSRSASPRGSGAGRRGGI